MKAFLTGLGIGVGLGILLAPERGEITRSKLRDRLSDWSDSVSDQVTDQMENLKKGADRVRAAASEMTENVRNRAASSPSSDADALNSISREELMQVNGIGPVLAEKIISGRPYSSLNELLERGILSSSTFEELQRELGTWARRSA